MRVRHTHQGKGVAQLEIDKLKKQVIRLTEDNKHLTERLADALSATEQMADKINS